MHIASVIHSNFLSRLFLFPSFSFFLEVPFHITDSLAKHGLILDSIVKVFEFCPVFVSNAMLAKHRRHLVSQDSRLLLGLACSIHKKKTTINQKMLLVNPNFIWNLTHQFQEKKRIILTIGKQSQTLHIRCLVSNTCSFSITYNTF